MSNCVSCNTPPSPCDCKSTQTCVQTSRDCLSCPRNICIESGTSHAPSSSGTSLGSIIGASLGGVLGSLALIGLIWFLYKRGLLNRFLSHRFSSSRRKSHQRPLYTTSSSAIDRKSKSFNPNQSSNQLNPSAQPILAHQKTASASARRTSEAILNQRNSNHLMNILPSEDSNNKLDGLEPLSLNINNHHNTPLIIQDDPFSDRNSTTSVNRQLPSIANVSSPLLGTEPSLFGLNSNKFLSTSSVPANAYIPQNSKSLSIQDVEDRDGLGNSSPLILSPSTPGSALDPALRRKSSNLILIDPSDPQRSPHPSPSAASALRSSFMTHQTPGLPPPAPSSNGTHLRPIRPPRAPGLDLRLPTAASQSGTTSQPSHLARKDSQTSSLIPELGLVSSRFSADTTFTRHSVASTTAASAGRWSQPPPMPNLASPTLSRPNYGSTDGMPIGSRLSLDSSHHSFHANQLRPMSNVSEATSHDSRLSSILDPAMIVTPVTLVRTASGRQAAVQRVALRGQEKARVVRLNRSASTASHHQQPPLPSHVPTHQTSGLYPLESPKESLMTLTNSPSTTRRALPPPASLNSALIEQNQPHSNPQTSPSASSSSGDPFADSAAVRDLISKNSQDKLSVEWNTLVPNPDTNQSANSHETPSIYSSASTVTNADDGHSCSLTIRSDHTQDRTHSTLAVVGQSQSNSSSPSLTHASTIIDDQPVSEIINDDHVKNPSETNGSRVTSSTITPRVNSRFMSSPSIVSRSSMAASSIGEDSFMDEGTAIVSTARMISDDLSSFAHQGNGASRLSVLQAPMSRISLSSLITQEKVADRNSLREPTRPFIGSTPGSGEGADARASVVSTSISVRSGYGSVLEGIPFNIGFGNSTDDEFGGLGDLTGVVEDEENEDGSMSDGMVALQFVEDGNGGEEH
ncbi:hypothetical protein DFH28DRAFT_4987 [Melampsora americana]|nr:hypothetical protein DFH28DRAFT_4987 [Melampsora americana]